MVPTRKNEQRYRPVTTLNTPCCAIRTIRVIHTTNTTNAEERVLLHVHARTEGASRTSVGSRENRMVCTEKRMTPQKTNDTHHKKRVTPHKTSDTTQNEEHGKKRTKRKNKEQHGKTKLQNTGVVRVFPRVVSFFFVALLFFCSRC